MQPLAINSFSPKCTIDVFTKNGEHFSQEIVNDAISLNIVRGVDVSAGMATLNLVANKDSKGRSWQDRIHPMDYIEIRAGNKYLSNGKLPIRFRGFLDSVVETLSMPIIGGPTRRISIVARDYMKLLLNFNIQYLWSVYLSDSVDGYYPGLEQNYGIPMALMAAPELLKLIVEKIIVGSGGNSPYALMPNLRQATNLSIPDLRLSTSIPSRYTMEAITISPYTGPLLSLISYLSSPPLGECFLYDSEDSPILVCRPVPFKDSNGNFVSPGQAPELPTIKIDPAIVSSYSLGKTDAQTQNFFFVTSDMNSSAGVPAPAFASQGVMNFGTKFNPYSKSSAVTNPAWAGKSAQIYGLKPLNIETPWVSLPKKDSSPDIQANAREMADFLYQVYDHNQDLIGGQIRAHGNENFIHGRYVQFSDAEFYLEQVEDTFSFKGDNNPTWSTVLSLTRGQGV